MVLLSQDSAVEFSAMMEICCLSARAIQDCGHWPHVSTQNVSAAKEPNS